MSIQFYKNKKHFFANKFGINYIFCMSVNLLKIQEKQEEFNSGDLVFYENSGWQGDGLYCVQIAGTLLVARLFLTATGFAFTTASLNPLSQVEVLGKVKGVFSSRF